ncbi:MAG: hypothetical protein AB1750_21245 [Chloroflexota bacterium]
MKGKSGMNSRTLYSNLLTKKILVCPNCKNNNLVMHELGISGSLWQIVLGRNPFTQRQMVGMACEDCGHVFLMLENVVGVFHEGEK